MIVTGYDPSRSYEPREYTKEEDREIYWRFKGWVPMYPNLDMYMENREEAHKKWEWEVSQFEAKYDEFLEWQFSGGPERIERYRRERD